MALESSLTISQNYPLKSLNTFGVDAAATYYAAIEHVQELLPLLSHPDLIALPMLVMGEGSNILFTKNFAGLVIKNVMRGITVIEDNADFVFIRVGAGENWHQFVMYCIEQGYGGIENLSLIPGTVGAAPVQNIGAYGVELKDVFYQLEAIHLQTGETRIFTREACQFGYRTSIFKHELKNKFMITSVVLKLHKKPKLNTSYSTLKNTLQLMNLPSLDIRIISETVMNIRRSKLPDPKVLGNAGSFFKNPIISRDHFVKIHTKYPDLPHFIQQDQRIKLNAAWLIEACGWKGKRLGDVGVYAHQALVLVNYGEGKGSDILKLAEQIQNSVYDRFGILLEPEVFLI